MKIELVRIIGLEAAWETRHPLRALASDGRAPALAQLEEWRRTQADDYKKIMRVLSLVGQNDRVTNVQHVKRGDVHKDIYEMRGKHARLFFFYAPGPPETVVLTHGFWKNASADKRQDAAFAQAATLRSMYMQSLRR